MKRARLAIRDVARRAGVSRRIVLRVLNGDPLVARETCARVEEATSEVGRQSNAVARSPAAGCTHTLACFAPNLTGYAFARISDGAEVECRQHGFFLISPSAPNEASFAALVNIDHSPIHGTKIDKGRWFTHGQSYLSSLELVIAIRNILTL